MAEERFPIMMLNPEITYTFSSFFKITATMIPHNITHRLLNNTVSKGAFSERNGNLNIMASEQKTNESSIP